MFKTDLNLQEIFYPREKNQMKIKKSDSNTQILFIMN